MTIIIYFHAYSVLIWPAGIPSILFLCLFDMLRSVCIPPDSCAIRRCFSVLLCFPWPDTSFRLSSRSSPYLVALGHCMGAPPHIPTLCSFLLPPLLGPIEWLLDWIIQEENGYILFWFNHYVSLVCDGMVTYLVWYPREPPMS